MCEPVLKATKIENKRTSGVTTSENTSLFNTAPTNFDIIPEPSPYPQGLHQIQNSSTPHSPIKILPQSPIKAPQI